MTKYAVLVKKKKNEKLGEDAKVSFMLVVVKDNLA